MPFFEADRSPIAAGGKNGLRYPQPLAAPLRQIHGHLAALPFLVPTSHREGAQSPGTPSVSTGEGAGRGGVGRAIRGIRTHSVKGLSPLSTLELLRSCRAIRTQTHALALLLSRFRFDYGVKPKVQATPLAVRRAGTELRCATPCDACGGRGWRWLSP